MEKRYTTDEAEKYLWEVFRLKRTAATLTTLRNRGRGARFLRVGRNIFYPESALIEYANGTTHYTRDSLDSQTLPEE
jgi:hypothetical protein